MIFTGNQRKRARKAVALAVAAYLFLFVLVIQGFHTCDIRGDHACRHGCSASGCLHNGHPEGPAGRSNPSLGRETTLRRERGHAGGCLVCQFNQTINGCMSLLLGPPPAVEPAGTPDALHRDLQPARRFDPSNPTRGPPAL